MPWNFPDKQYASHDRHRKFVLCAKHKRFYYPRTNQNREPGRQGSFPGKQTSEWEYITSGSCKWGFDLYRIICTFKHLVVCWDGREHFRAKQEEEFVVSIQDSGESVESHQAIHRPET